MFLKSSVSCLLLVSFVSGNLATPASRFRRDSAGEISSPSNHLTSDSEKSGKQLAENTFWIFNNTISVLLTGLREECIKVDSWVLNFLTRAELSMMVDGSHFYLPLHGQSEMEQDHKTVATAVFKLLLNLKTMEQTDVVLKNVSRYVAKYVVLPLKKSGMSFKNGLKTYLHSYIEVLDQRMEADENLRDEYKNQKTEAREAVKRDPKMLEAFFKLWDPFTSAKSEALTTFLQDKVVFRQAVANKLFLKQATKHFSMIFSPQAQQRYLLARAFIQKAKSDSGTVNQVYHEALVRAAEVVLQSTIWSAGDDVVDTLFDSLEKSLKSDPALNVEIQSMIEEIKGKIVYDTDMLFIDFSPL